MKSRWEEKWGSFAFRLQVCIYIIIIDSYYNILLLYYIQVLSRSTFIYVFSCIYIYIRMCIYVYEIKMIKKLMKSCVQITVMYIQFYTIHLYIYISKYMYMSKYMYKGIYLYINIFIQIPFFSNIIGLLKVKRMIMNHIQNLLHFSLNYNKLLSRKLVELWVKKEEKVYSIYVYICVCIFAKICPYVYKYI
jgi:hypothetical protein